jgi:beta-mannosidase
MHRRFEIDVKAELAAVDVEIAVDFAPALLRAEAAEAANPLPRPDIYELPYNQIRKMACSFGWDWGPTTVTAGRWKPVVLHTWSTARLVDLRVVAVPATATAVSRVEVRAEVEGPAATLAVSVEGGPAGRAEFSGGIAAVAVDVPDARLWWPIGHGEQPLYGVTVQVLDADGGVLDSGTRRVGFRTVEAVQTPDEDGSSFALTVNGRRMWVRGLNWIPDDVFPDRITRERLHTRIVQAIAAGTNLLRVWGGGIFESEDFYDVCDELGVLVWQDFLFACAAYPEDAATVEQVRAEVRDNVLRLAHRASLAVWCGCNENLWGYEDWDWKPALNGRPWGATYYYEILPKLLTELDGTRPYVPGSPFSPEGRHPNSEDVGTMHVWDVWNDLDYTHYEDKRPRFAAEFGYQAPASWPTLVTAIGGEPAAEDPRLDVHQKAGDGAEKLRVGLLRHFTAVPGDGKAWYFGTQLLQARAVKIGVGHFRSLHDRCSGTIWWQHNDCWPAVSWSIVDVAGRHKLAWYAMRDTYAPRLAVLGGGREDARLTLVNDTDRAWPASVRLQACTADGETVASGTARAEVGAGSHVELSVPQLLGPLPAEAVLLVADHNSDGNSARATRWLVPDLDLRLPQGELSVSVSPDGPDAVLVDVTAVTLARDVSLLAELVAPDAAVDRQLLTLLPGERASFRVSGPGVEDVPELGWADLLWHDQRVRAVAES